MKSIVTRRTFLSATTATTLSGLLPAPSRTLAAVAAPAQLSAEPCYLGKPLHQLVQDMHRLDNYYEGGRALVDALGCIGLPALPCLESAMREGSPVAREVAVRAIGGLMSPIAIPILVAALNDDDLDVRRAAAGCLAEFTPVVQLDEPVVALLLRHRDPPVAWQVILAWAYEGQAPTTAVPFLTQLLQDPLTCERFDAINQNSSDFPEWNTRCILVQALGSAQPLAFDELSAVLQDESAVVRRVAAEILVKHTADDSRTVAVAHNLLQDRDPQVRIAAAGSIMKDNPNDVAAGRELLMALESSDLFVASAAHHVLCMLHVPFPGEVEFLCGLLDGSDLNLVGGAAILLGELGPHAEAAVPRLLRLLENTNVNAINHLSSLITALGRIGSREAIPQLIATLSHPEPSIRCNAAAALWKIEPHEQAIDVLIDNLQGETAPFSDAADAIAEIGPPAARAVPVLIESLRLGNDLNGCWTKSYAAKALGAIGPASEPAVPYLVRAILGGTPVFFDGTAQALGKIGDRGIAPLVMALNDGSIHVRVRAAEAIGQIGPAAVAAVPALVAMLGEMDLAAQVAAADALGNIGQKAEPAENALRKLLDSQSNRVRCSARHASGPVHAKFLSGKDVHQEVKIPSGHASPSGRSP